MVWRFTLRAVTLILCLTLFGIGVSSVVKANPVDSIAIRACQEYAQNHPERSIPRARKDWAVQNNIQWVYVYDYYQDCINQRLYAVAGAQY